jgi:hypothetical protein
MLTILVSGGRDYANRAEVFRVLDLLAEEAGAEDVEIVHGGATGADALADEWAREREVNSHRYAAKWTRHGRAAGHKRNRAMLEHARPRVVVAFPGGPGTRNMCENVEKWEGEYDPAFAVGEARVYVHESLRTSEVES